MQYIGNHWKILSQQPGTIEDVKKRLLQLLLCENSSLLVANIHHLILKIVQFEYLNDGWPFLYPFLIKAFELKLDRIQNVRNSILLNNTKIYKFQ